MRDQPPDPGNDSESLAEADAPRKLELSRSFQDVEDDPATYYEALTGRRDPARDTFVSARRAINLLVWILALGLPIGLTALTIATGQSLDTIVFVGIGALIVGMMFRSSFPKTPFD
ncbi:hypothetical protein BH23CHL6_BH23CHL6_00150 [soil metagenome]